MMLAWNYSRLPLPARRGVLGTPTLSAIDSVNNAINFAPVEENPCTSIEQYRTQDEIVKEICEDSVITSSKSL
jgi:hypothetical protein